MPFSALLVQKPFTGKERAWKPKGREMFFDLSDLE